MKNLILFIALIPFVGISQNDFKKELLIKDVSIISVLDNEKDTHSSDTVHIKTEIFIENNELNIKNSASHQKYKILKTKKRLSQQTGEYYTVYDILRGKEKFEFKVKMDDDLTFLLLSSNERDYAIFYYEKRDL